MLGATVKQEHWPVHPGSNERKTCAPYYQTRYIEQRICIWMNVIKVIEKWEKKEKSLLINVAILCHLRYKRIVRQSNKTGLLKVVRILKKRAQEMSHPSKVLRTFEFLELLRKSKQKFKSC